MSYRNHPGYPPRPQVDNMSENEAQEALADWKRKCKQFTDRERKRVLKEAEGIVNENITYTGVTDPRLRTMVEVVGARLRVGDSFPNRDLLAIRIAEEAIQVNTAVTVTRSDSVQYRVVGVRFYAQANKNLIEGWVVTKLQVNVEGAGLAMPSENTKEKSATTLLRTEWLVALVLDEIRERPNISNDALRGYLLAYAPKQYFTDNILQNTRTKAKLEVFGQPDTNVQYVYHLKAAMEERGHPCELLFSNRGSVMSSISKIFVDDKNRRRYRDGLSTSMTGPERVAFLTKWLSDNKVSIDRQMGVGIGNKYLSGIFFSTSVGLQVVPFLQKVIQADGCHVNFGKYTIYTAYGSGADGTMFLISCAIIFGNETSDGWGRFWEFTVNHYPFLNHSDYTIITDQDKGSINAIERHLPNAVHFFCSWHRRGNVLKKCQGGKKTYGGYWFFNQLLQCNTLNDINRCREKYEDRVPAHALGYLARVPDIGQYPGARCDMGDNVYMYGRTASSGNESMNRANMRARERYGVDLVVATMIMMKLAAKRFNNKRKVAWHTRDTILTRKGLEIRIECFRNYHVRNYQYQVQEMNDRWVIMVHDRSADEMQQHTVEIAKEPGRYGSRFGTCTCGRPKLLGAPCAHMVVVVKTGRIPLLNEDNIMPYWWYTQQMRQQYPQELEFMANMDMALLKNMGVPSSNLYYCPDLAGPKKTGRPKNASRIVGALELAGRGRGGGGGGRGRGRGRGRGQRNEGGSDVVGDGLDDIDVIGKGGNIDGTEGEV